MKNLIKLLIFLFITGSLLAQKVDMDRNSMSIKHSLFPSSSVLSPFKTYQARISEPVGFLTYYELNRLALIHNLVNIGGYQKAESNAEFILDIILNDLQYTENKTVTNTNKDKAG